MAKAMSDDYWQEALALAHDDCIFSPSQCTVLIDIIDLIRSAVAAEIREQ